MNESMAKFFEKSPELLAVILLVWLFLRAMKERDTAAKERDTLFIAAIRQVSEQHIEAREQSRKVIEENTIHTMNVNTTMATLTEVMRSCGFRPPNLIPPKKVDSPGQEA